MSDRRPVRVVRSTDQADSDAVRNVPGNHYDKHGSSNPVVRRLMDRFHDRLLELGGSVDHRTVLDVGCGEGRTTAILEGGLGPERLVGCDLEVSAVSEGPINTDRALFFAGSVYTLPFESKSFDLVVATEVLEHLDDPRRALMELARVAGSGVLVTVPNEPWWRFGNMARGAYLRHLGNTPGHVQHWTTHQFRRFLGAGFPHVEVVTATMWNMALIRL
jgi:SAM-dependent methyltransferase